MAYSQSLKNLLASSLSLSETLAGKTIIDIYKKFINGEELTQDEELAMNMFKHLCNIEATGHL
jgi:hypothetical protein